jgi:hypothetical protein
METTFAEIIEMRNALNRALCEKVGYEIVSGFNVEMSSWYDDTIEFGTAYTKHISSLYLVSGDRCSTPQEAYESAMKAISDHSEPTKQDRIEELKKQIKALEND